MFENRRSEIEIMNEILTLSRDGARKTELLYRGNLSYTQLQNYLKFLIDKNIIEEKTIPKPTNGSSKIFITTEKGQTLLRAINNVLLYLK